MTIVTYAQRYRPMKKKPPAPAIEGSAIVTAKKPGPRQRAEAEPPPGGPTGVAQAGDAGAPSVRRLNLTGKKSRRRKFRMPRRQVSGCEPGTNPRPVHSSNKHIRFPVAS